MQTPTLPRLGPTGVQSNIVINAGMSQSNNNNNNNTMHPAPSPTLGSELYFLHVFLLALFYFFICIYCKFICG
jgi:hypothetical protein